MGPDRFLGLDEAEPSGFRSSLTVTITFKRVSVNETHIASFRGARERAVARRHRGTGRILALRKATAN